jgi:hypothetical protein
MVVAGGGGVAAEPFRQDRVPSRQRAPSRIFWSIVKEM